MQSTIYIDHVVQYMHHDVWYADHIHVYDPSLRQWFLHRVGNSCGLVLCRHTATALPQQPPSILFLGGGMNCFGFGTTFSPPVLLDLTPLTKQHTPGNADPHTPHQASDGTKHVHKADNTLAAAEAATRQASDIAQHRQNPGKTLTCGLLPEEAVGTELTGHAVTNAGGTPAPGGVTQGGNLLGGAGRGGTKAADSCETAEGRLLGEQSSSPQPACQGEAKAQIPGNQGVAVARLQAKAAKDALKHLGWLDQAYKAHSDLSTDVICLPLTHGGRAMLQSAQLSPAELSHADGDTGAHFVLNGTSASAVSNGAVLPVPTERCVSKGSSVRPKGSTAGGKEKRQKHEGSQEGDRACLLGLLQAGHAVVQPMEAHVSSRAEGGPAQRMRGAAVHLLHQQVGLTVVSHGAASLQAVTR